MLWAGALITSLLLAPPRTPRHAPVVLQADTTLPPPLAAALPANGIAQLNPLQEAALGVAMRGLDCIVHAETGSGKTLCFALPLLARIGSDDTPLQGLIVAPTLELAAQTARVLNAPPRPAAPQ